MADLDPINPSSPVRPPAAESEREQAHRRQPVPKRAPRRPHVEPITDDMGERQESPPLVDEFA